LTISLVHECDDLIALFNECFIDDYQTQLARGQDEPLYLPANDQNPLHTIYFAHGFFSSALHECAHWLIAGAERRKLIDFGYWYAPDGRTQEQQKAFHQVEVKPQALEWILSKAAGYKFYISADNLNGEPGDETGFKEAVFQQVMHLCATGLSARAQKLRLALCHYYNQNPHLSAADFDIASL